MPGQMHDAQAAVEQTLTLRRNALSAIASNVTQAAARTQTANAITTIENAMGALYASDILWTQIGSPEIKKVLQDEGIDGQPLPPGKFMPANATDYLNQATLVTKLNAITGQTATTGGVHGLSLESTTIGGTTLQPDTTNNVPSDAQEIDISVTNSGDSDETGITVNVTLGGSSLRGDAPIAERRPVRHGEDPADQQALPGDQHHAPGGRQPGARRAAHRQQHVHLHGRVPMMRRVAPLSNGLLLRSTLA